MRVAKYSPNNIIDKDTGFIENPAYPYAFDAKKKTKFLKTYMANGLDIYATCDIIGVERNTVIKHYHNDPVFKEKFDAVEHEFASRLEGISRVNSLSPRLSLIHI